MEGINFGAILLGFLGAIVFAIVALVALVLAIARRRRAALITIASGILATLLIAALATLTFLGGRYSSGLDDSHLWLTAATLVMAGVGQFIAVFRRAGIYVAALCCGAAALIFLTVFPPEIAADVMPKFGGAVESVAFPGYGVRLAGSLILAGSSLLVAVPRAQRWSGVALWALLGSLLGAGAGQAVVETHCTFLTPMMTRARVEVRVLDVRVSEETGSVKVPGDGPFVVRSLSREQAMWVYGPPVIGALVVGLVCAGVAFTVIPGGRGLPFIPTCPGGTRRRNAGSR